MSDFACLAIESSTSLLSVAACNGNRSSVIEDGTSRTPSRQIFQLIQQVLTETGLETGSLDCVAFGCGPGSFTGVRVAVAAAQSIAWSAGVPVCRVSGLEAMALSAMEKHQVTRVASCLDARMGEAYLAVYRREGDSSISTVLEDRLVDPAVFVLPGDENIFAAGAGWDAYPELSNRHTERLSGSDAECLPSAAPMLQLAHRTLRNGDAVVAAEALPNYIRDKVT